MITILPEEYKMWGVWNGGMDHWEKDQHGIVHASNCKALMVAQKSALDEPHWNDIESLLEVRLING